MATADRSTILARLQAYRNCELAILTGAQSYRVENKEFTRASLPQVREAIKELEAALSSTNPSTKTMRFQRILPKRF